MKPLVELISEWDSYASRHPAPTVADFCAQYLQRQQRKNKKVRPDDAATLNTEGIIAELVGRLGKQHTILSKLMLKEFPDIELEWFYLMNVILLKKEGRKTEVISLSQLEQSTGIDILNRMKNRGLIKEKNDPEDKRAKRVSLTAKGKSLLLKIGAYLYKVSYLLYHDVKESDKQVLIKLLNDIHTKQQQLLTGNADKTIDEMIASVYGKHALDEVAAAFKKLVETQENVLRSSKGQNVDELIRSFYK